MRKENILRRIAVLALTLACCYGCADGPFYALKKLNPYYQRQWAKDSALGPTYQERIAEMRLLRSQLTTMTAAEQSEWMEMIDAIIEHDPGPEMRREAVLALSDVNSDAAFALLQKASSDENRKVRMAVCESTKNKDPDKAMPLLQSLLKDEDVEGVQLAAITALGEFKGPQAEGMLAGVLQERSPAVQYAATQALAKSTGKKYGGDVAKWKSYLAGQPTEEVTPTIAERVTDWIPFY